MSTEVELRAPKGKFRVVRIELVGAEGEYPVGDFEIRDTAFAEADTHNKNRKDAKDSMYYVYDDRGLFIRGPAAVGQPGV